MMKNLAVLIIGTIWACAPNVLNAQQLNGRYFCTVEFSGGLDYDELTKRWHSTTFHPDHKFILRLRFIETNQDERYPEDLMYDAYDMSITDSGESQSHPCLSDGKKVAAKYYAKNYRNPNELPQISCSTYLHDYRFNFKDNRFLEDKKISLQRCFLSCTRIGFSFFFAFGKRETPGAYAMRDPLEWAAHYRKRAAECIELADSSFDAGIEAHYRSLAGRYIKLAEAEEDFATTRPGHHRLSPRLDATG